MLHGDACVRDQTDVCAHVRASKARTYVRQMHPPGVTPDQFDFVYQRRQHLDGAADEEDLGEEGGDISERESGG